MEVTGGDSGVETECDLESNDSSMSSISVGGATDAAPLIPSPHLPPLPPPPPERGDSSSHSSPPPPVSLPPPPPAAAEDGYLGDCSSDGGNEKNFPLPADWNHKPNSCACHPSRTSLPPSPLQADTPHSPPPEDVDPPAGLQFCSLVSSPDGGGGLGYHLLPSHDWGHQSNLKTKMRSPKSTSGLRSKYNNHVQDDWTKVKTAIAERKLRGAANTNNTDLVETLLTGHLASVKSVDEHKRSALHFAAAKGYSEVVEVLLRHGADPNQKDRLGNTAMHLAACTNHVPVVTLLLKAGTDLTTLDNNGRTPLQLAQTKLKILQRNSSQSGEMSRVKAEVSGVLEMMKEYLTRVAADNGSYQHLLQSFSERLTLHTTHTQITTDLGSLLQDLASMTINQGEILPQGQKDG
eukprot:TRINITY_DN34861_c0_g1_i1.p1 TRINITY_DN34861_c0_g1~~TRINITY_DN34861_c0_g1_i1.p1  ORF type:complete len:406 (+),score=162.70 TRINITY_DN34861_c0_g1_i1:152-1369(+)